MERLEIGKSLLLGNVFFLVVELLLKKTTNKIFFYFCLKFRIYSVLKSEN